MSNRDSLGFGDLIPQDVVDILSQEKHSNKSRKKRSNSLGRALGWLKGKKKKDLGSKRQNLGLGPALDLALDGPAPGNQGGHKGGQKSGKQAHPPAVPKLDDDDRTPAAPLFQENVFIETSRPEYLENLHSEALEGLKMMQQEETNNGVEYQDSESTVSTTMVHTDGEGGGFMTDSTIADSTSVVSVKSTVSSRSSRSGLTRQESTFRPLNSGKKAKRRKHRRTVAGIPQHVQQELGLDRVGWTLTQTVDEEQLYNGESDLSPTADSPHQTALPPTGTANVIHPLSKDQLDQLAAANSGHVDDLALLHHLDPNLPADQRPHSLAVPWMTTGNSLQQEPPSPVITMSPQAAYMSKIIPNAVLPPSIDVVEISRGRSRNSVRTVSKSSLVLSSPAPSRASSRASTRTNSSKASTITSASRQNPPNMSDSSCWSNSESSETLVSDSSTISSSSTPRQKRSHDGNASAREDKVSVHSSSKGTSNGSVAKKREAVNKDGQFVRSLSIMKPKRAPPPPSRSYSLHSKMKRRSRDLAEIRVIPGVENVAQNKQVSSPVPSKPIDSPGYNADTSSLDDSTGSASFSPIRSKLKQEEAPKKDVPDSQTAPKDEDKKVKMVSPSSGYSSQEGTSAQSLKQSHSSSPRHKRGLLAKLQRLFPGSAPSSPTPPTATPTPPPSEDIKRADNLKLDPSVQMSPSVRALRELFNIPPHPKVHAPPPPPPEVWVHSRKSIELLLGPPVPDDIYAIIKKNPKDKRPYRQSPSASAEGSMKLERKNKTATVEVDGCTQVTEVKKVPESVILKADVHKENIDRLAEKKVTEKVSASDILSGMLVKAVVKREERLAREEEAKKSSTKVASPESAWPPPPPPVGQMVITDEMEFPLPPPPMFGESLVIPVQVPPAESSSTTKTLDIPPPPSYSAPPPPVGALTPATMRRNSPLPPIEEVPFTPPPEEVSPPQLPVQVSPPFLPPPPVEVSLPAPPKEVTPPPPPLNEVIRLKQVKEVSQPPPPPTVMTPPAPPEVIPPPPLLIEVVQLQPPRKVSPPPPPPPKQVTSVPPTLSKVVTPPPPPPVEVVQPQPPKQVSSSPPKELASVPPTPPKEVSPTPSPPKEVTPPPIIQLQPPKEVTPLPPPVIAIEVHPPKEVNSSPTPPKEIVLLPPSKDVSPPQPLKEISPSPPPEDVPPPPPQEVIVPPPPPPQEITPSPPPPKEVIQSTPPEEVSPAQQMEVCPPGPPPPVIEISTTLVAPPPVQEAPPPPFVEVTTLSTLEEATPVSTLTPPQSIPPPPPKEETTPPEEPETVVVSTVSILTPPQSIPPPPPIQPPPEEKCVNTDSPEAQETPPPPTPEVTEPASEKAEESAPTAPETIPEPPTVSSVELQPSPEQSTIPPVAEEASPAVTPSLLQAVKLRSVNSSPEPPKAPEQAEVENSTSNDDTNASTSSEAPQKPIRQSLILTSPTSTSPPTVVISQPALPKSHSLVIPPTSTSTSLSPTKKSPPAMTASPSMNLQEAIRLRTAARSRENSTTRLSLHSPTSPIDRHKSPTSTASFIFSKSNRRMVMETKPVTEKSVDPVTKVQGGAEVEKKGLKVPPPVAKKPKSKGKEVETSEVMEQTAGQEAQKEGIEDVAEKASGTAGTV